MLPVLEGHLDADFHGRGAIVGIEDLAQPGRGHLHQSFGQQYRLVIRQPQQGRMLQPVHLSLDRVVDLLAAMTMDVGPDRSDSVQPAVALGIDQPRPFPPLNNDRVFASQSRIWVKGCQTYGRSYSCRVWVSGFFMRYLQGREVLQEAAFQSDLLVSRLLAFSLPRWQRGEPPTPTPQHSQISHAARILRPGPVDAGSPLITTPIISIPRDRAHSQVMRV